MASQTRSREEFLGLPRVPSEFHHSTPHPNLDLPLPLSPIPPPQPNLPDRLRRGPTPKVNPYDPSPCETKQFSRRDRKKTMMKLAVETTTGRCGEKRLSYDFYVEICIY